MPVKFIRTYRRRRGDVRANLEAAVKAIVLDLYRAQLSDPSLEVGIGMRRENLQERSKWQYGSSRETGTDHGRALCACKAIQADA